jgi:hypothetical protein
VILAIAALLSMAIVLAVAPPVLMTLVVHGPVTDRRLGISVGHVSAAR